MGEKRPDTARRDEVVRILAHALVELVKREARESTGAAAHPRSGP